MRAPAAPRSQVVDTRERPPAGAPSALVEDLEAVVHDELARVVESTENAHAASGAHPRLLEGQTGDDLHYVGHDLKDRTHGIGVRMPARRFREHVRSQEQVAGHGSKGFSSAGPVGPGP